MGELQRGRTTGECLQRRKKHGYSGTPHPTRTRSPEVADVERNGQRDCRQLISGKDSDPLTTRHSVQNPQGAEDYSRNGCWLLGSCLVAGRKAMLADAAYQPTKRGPYKKREGALVTGLRHCFGLSSPVCCHSVSALKRETHAPGSTKMRRNQSRNGWSSLQSVRGLPCQATPTSGILFSVGCVPNGRGS